MINASQHAMERYVQRAMGYSDQQKVKQYVKDNSDTINEWMNKMIEFGKNIYFGKVKNGKSVNVVIKDVWVLLLDKDEKNIVTIYKVNLIHDDMEFNKMFADRMIERIENKKNELITLKEKGDGIENQARVRILEKEDRISIFQKQIDSLKESINADNEIIKMSQVETKACEAEIQSLVEDLVARKVF